jgi:spore germination protein GerM
LSNAKGGFSFKKTILSLSLLIFLCAFTLYEIANTKFTRRTFVFYGIMDDTEFVEERMLPHLENEEAEIRRYVEEALLGPVFPESAPLFSRETRLRSLLYRDGTVFIDISEAAALPPLEDMPLSEETVIRSLTTLEEGIKRNFPEVLAVSLFINGFRMDI